MHHSTWDLEVHAREMQRRRLREADQARQIETARQCGDQMRVPANRFNIARLMTAFWDYLSPRRDSIATPESPALTEAAFLPLPVEQPRLSPNARPAVQPHPYAGMVVLAKRTSAQSAAQPCAAGDC